ncbi:nSTAND1 domain-containing NTPase [Streptomyces sp. NPDC001840]
MGRPERELDPEAGPLQRFASELRRLRAAAGLSYRELSKRAHFSVTALSEAAGGERLPTLAVTLAYAEACGGERADWEERWRKLSAELAPEAPVPDRGTEDAPYLGLATFGVADEERFFGRGALITELRSRLAELPLLAVFGASGAGKSSLLRAGLLPALHKESATGGGTWRTVLLTPGDHPVQELAIHLANLLRVPASVLHDTVRDSPESLRITVRQIVADHPGPAQVLILVDQFEEIFTLCQDAGERRRFIELLLAVTGEPAVRVVLGIRADFYARCAEHDGLVQALDGHQLLIGPMDATDLRQVVTGPARRAGIKVEPELVETVVAEAQNRPGALPLVSHALLETWRRRRGAALTAAAYRAAGGVHGAIAQSAEAAYGELDTAQQRIAEEMVLRLVAPGDGTEATRCRAPLGELLGGPDSAAVSAVLDRLIAARLVTSDSQGVTIAHEAVIRKWPRLRSWLAENEELLRAQRRLTVDAREWDQHGRDTGFLYRGARLAWWDGRETARFNTTESAFLEAARRVEAQARAGVRRRTRFTLAALATGVVVVSALAGVALAQADRASAERATATSRQLAAEARAQLLADPRQALSMARRAYRTAPTREADAVLRQAVADDRQFAVVPGERGRALGVAFSADGHWLADTSTDGTVRIWRWSRAGVSGHKPAAVLRGHRSEAWSPVFSPDGRRLATAGLDGTVRVWDVRGRAVPVVLRGHRGPVWNVAFSPDGSRITSAGDDGTVRIWDAGGRGAPTVLRGHQGPAIGVAFSPDGRQVASGGEDSTVRLWNTSGRGGPRVLRGHEQDVKRLAFSPDGSLLASASVDGTARIWPTAGGGAPLVLRGHDGTVEGVAFSPDGTRLVTASDDATMRVWNTSAAAVPLVLRGHQGTVWSAQFSPDGRWLASASEDGSVRVWDPRGPGDPVVLRGHDGPVWAASVLAGDTSSGARPGGPRVAGGGQDGTLRIWHTATGTQRVLRGHGDEIVGMAAAPDGRRVASAGLDGTVRVWDTTRTSRPVILRGYESGAWSVAFSPDGQRIAGVDGEGALRIEPAAGGPSERVLRAPRGLFRTVAFSPDGRVIAAGGTDAVIRMWDLGRAGEPRLLRSHQGFVWSVAFSPDGRRIASAGSDGTVRIWDLERPGDPVVLDGHQGFAWFVVFSPDGRWIASAGKDGTVRLWPSGTASEPVTFGGFGASVESVAFTSDSRRLVTAHDDGTVRLWTCEVCGPAERILALADAHLAGPAGPTGPARPTRPDSTE